MSKTDLAAAYELDADAHRWVRSAIIRAADAIAEAERALAAPTHVPRSRTTTSREAASSALRTAREGSR